MVGKTCMGMGICFYVTKYDGQQTHRWSGIPLPLCPVRRTVISGEALRVGSAERDPDLCASGVVRDDQCEAQFVLWSPEVTSFRAQPKHNPN